ncbi:MAG: hypothetical protein ABIS01_03690 [Ferruginibacter sp.]
MKRLFFYKIITAILLFVPQVYLYAQQRPAVDNALLRQFNLVPAHDRDTQNYFMESKLLKYDLDGTRKGWDVYRLYLQCVPQKNSVKGDEYTCTRFTVQLNNSPEVSIPSLANWEYFFSVNAKDEKGQLFGIDHSKFDQLVDEKGKALAIENTYHVYNAFIDFHSMNVFAEKPDTGKGIQDLKRIGQKIIHGASFSQPTVSLGSKVADGSYFKNGEITLEFKGVSLVNNKTCAILEYDSGESSFTMVVKPMANMEVKTKGSSHYQGDIYKDLNGGWIQRATMRELVVSETVVPGFDKINSVIERNITINNVAKNGF